MKTRRLVRFFTVLGALGVAAVTLAQTQPTQTQTRNGYNLPPGWEMPVMDHMRNSFTLVERAEFRTGEIDDTAVLDAQGWIGGDFQRFWWKIDSEQLTRSPKSGEFEVQALYSRLIRPFWDVQAGLRLDRTYSGPDRETRGRLVLALEGLAPLWFEVEPALFISDKGKVSFSFIATYELLLTQRLVLEPRIDLRLDAAEQKDVARFIGEGANDLDFGLRLRYDIRRQFSPYIGVEWHRALGASAGIARRAGTDVSRTAVVFGLRGWF